MWFPVGTRMPICIEANGSGKLCSPFGGLERHLLRAVLRIGEAYIRMAGVRPLRHTMADLLATSFAKKGKQTNN